VLYNRYSIAGACLCAGLLANFAAAQTRVDVNVDVEVLTRGPVHEAYASVVQVEPEPVAAVQVVRPPPPPIDEYPPEEIPEAPGGDVEWIPGYWAWDEERNDYVWVSGVWRTPPPGTSWYPGYWTQADGGYEYASGAWIPEVEDEIEYLPPPPRDLDQGPPGPPPSPNHVWVPGTWYWEDSYDWNVNAGYDPRFGVRVQVGRPRQAGYVWRPGYWMIAQPDWLWVPAHYVWTPRGCIFVAGYWDYPLERRGVLFTPVYFARPAAVREIRYSPSIAIDVDVLSLHLFTRPRVTHYYFGDYYADDYVRIGYRPFFETHRHHHVYDPIFVHLRWRHRGDDRWFDDLRRGYEYRRVHVDARPARTYREQQTRVTTVVRGDRGDVRDARDRRSLLLARPLNEVGTGDSRVRTSRIDQNRREQYSQRGREVRSYGERRRGWESEGTAAPRRDGRRARPDDPRRGDPRRGEVSGERTSQRVKVQRSPVSSRSPEARSRAPQRPNSPGAPEPRKIRGRRGGDDNRDTGRERPRRDKP
jgi:hypothetical protein